MRFTISQLAACSGGDHINGKISINGGALRDFSTTRSVLKGGDDSDPERLIVQRLKSVVLESGANTNAQIKAAVEAQEWQV